MPKFMNNRYFMDLQMFAEDEGDPAKTGDSGDGDDQDDDQEDGADEGGENEPRYTKADLDKAVARTIAKERSKAERAAKRQAQKKEDESQDTESEDAKARKAAEDKASALEVKVACYDAGVKKDAVDDVAALARSYMAADEDLDLEEAIEKVVKKYPQFKTDDPDPDDEGDDAASRKKSWGERQRGSKKKEKSLEDEITEALYGKK